MKPQPLCLMCLKPADMTPRHRQKMYEETGRAYCSKTCAMAYRAKCSSEAMTRTNLKYASARMLANNPMRNEETRKKVSETLRAINHAPKIRGGNGKPATAAESALALILDGLGFMPQHAILTKMPMGSGYPPCYKPDSANVALKLAVEADGNSHALLSRQAQDAKKDEFLRGLGWTVLRFTNHTILTEPAQVLKTVLSTISKLKGCTPTSQMA